MKKLLIATMLAGSFAVTLPLTASADVIVVRTAPPAPRHEVIPPARHGYVWAPGYWNWTGHRYVWTRGHYVKARAGFHWAAPSWQERDGRWQFTRGEWRHGDDDRDGVPNRYDRDRRGDNDRDGVPNRYDRDRDNDGVPNRYDDRPDNPRRH